MTEAANRITFEFPPNDLREFNRMLSLMESRLGKDTGESTRWGMYHAAKAAAASTKKAPKRRRLLRNKGVNEQFPASEYPYMVKVWAQGREEPMEVFVDRVNAKERRIKRSGLAKNAWKWGITRMGMRAGARQGYASRRSVVVDDKSKALNPEIAMTSVLPYAGKALKGSGNQAVSTIMRRASNSMRKYMERRLKQRIQERNR